MLRPNARILDICDMPVEIEARMAEISAANSTTLKSTTLASITLVVYQRTLQGRRRYGQAQRARVSTVIFPRQVLTTPLVKDPDWAHTFKNAATISTLFQDYLPQHLLPVLPVARCLRGSTWTSITRVECRS